MSKRSHEFLPFGVKFRTRDNFGKWGNWQRREPYFWQEEQRDAEFAKLSNRAHIEYERVTDMAELDGQLKAMERLK